ncbi:hypothetical protein J3B02_000558 [Coemansia erecta]|uniref:O-acyltransferase n=1 Tax=Coemansia asiatica TaxID=1052880 RepID=A0A9W7XNZ7_9FUNG|nr:hypothetical protein LPJ64_002275 [Coemansia asiatica]KAJ2858068.1 hypothetical protein J3B02_000558 [Coemansia erecta]KAJ2879810.1 hypothetical protein FB639_002989 [Coemansia asiatica]
MNKTIDAVSIRRDYIDGQNATVISGSHRKLGGKDSSETLRRHSPKMHSGRKTASEKRARQRPGASYLQAQVVHYKPRVSVLDKELTTVSYHGLVNFLLLLLSATLVRLAIENYMKYGILVSIPGAGVSRRDWAAMLAGLAAVAASFFAALAIEKQAVPRKQQRVSSSRCKAASVGGSALAQVGVDAGDKLTAAMHLGNLCFVLVAPSCITYFGIFQPALGTMVMMCACIMFLKLYSLAATNFDLRRAYRLQDKRLDRDPLRLAAIERGHLAIGGASSSPDPSDRAGAGAGSDTDVCSESSEDEDEVADDLVGSTAGNSQEAALTSTASMPSMKNSFSLTARALADIPVAGDDRIDAKADALPRPRIRRRAAISAANVLKLVADSSESATPPPQQADPSAAGSNASANTTHPGFDVAVPETAADGSRAISYAVAYPDNVTLRNFGYFWLAPTLCYQPSYPRMAGPISKSFVAKRVSELVIICVTMYVIIQQYAVPTLVGSVKAIDTRNGFWLSERVLKLSVISATIWFLGFYALFHAGLNALAEVLRFADRAFYLDWWNSVDLAAYWREWNLPIHYFCKRHIMVPLISAPLNLPVGAGVGVTFLFSAVMHELLFGIPTHCLKGYSFVGMMAQIPLIQLTQWLVRWRGSDSGLGNAVFWISFCIVGQPLGVVQYYYTWVKNNP